ncbi:3-hydroxyacyl-CoA dehydrogenase type-2 [Schistosoma japonicum]|uniref:3-hydroxyacyl-CoA dehydrogenase type-2 n=1 Tax=Schistosoma japonicum TaxID=6182 RepID=Q5DDQ5_SCHJA|nr:SJCHGC01481 protein [Schistosoma japonicum]KAH8872834.1 3-hydroxyacyl-CoA dehydrogenase type-2 [Schistosoma japonicum]
MFASLKGLSAIVTGGSSGLGLATTKKLIAEGCNVLVCDIQKSPLLSELGSNCVYCETDVTSESDVVNAVSLAQKTFSNLHILVNCAGISMACKTYNVKRQKPHPLDLFENVIKTNLIGTFNMIRLASAAMVTNIPDSDNQRGVIINTASIAAYEGQVGQAAYAASKGGITSLTLPIARDLAREGIRCVSIAPGLFNTPLLNSVPNIDLLKKLSVHPNRLGQPEEFAQLVESIIRNPMLNGTVIRLDGGIRLPP